ncbi:MAG: hypothetical protein V1725_05380 [archaeon]
MNEENVLLHPDTFLKKTTTEKKAYLDDIRKRADTLRRITSLLDESLLQTPYRRDFTLPGHSEKLAQEAYTVLNVVSVARGDRQADVREQADRLYGLLRTPR